MEEFSFQIEKIAGRASDTEACGVFTKRLPFANGTFGTVVSCILVDSDSSFDSQTALSEIFELQVGKLEDIYDGILEALRVIGDICGEYAREKNIAVSYAQLVFFKEAVYIGRLGEKVRIAVYEAPKSQEIKFNFGSG